MKDIAGNADIDGTTNLDIVDIDGAVQVDSTITVGADDQGYDIKFFGDTASAYMLWDTSEDDLVLAGAAGIDLAGNIDVDGTANLDVVDIDGAVQIDGTVTVGVDGTGLDVKLFSASAGAYMHWDESADLLDIRGATAAGAGLLKLTTGELTVVDGNKLGRIDFQAPLESDGTDSILVAASIWAEADDTFSTSVNNTDIVFATGKSEAAAEKFRFTADNEIGVAGANYGTDGQVLTSGGAGAAVAWEDASSSAADDISAGDAAVSLATSSGDVTVDSNAGAVSIDGHTGVTLASSNSGDITLDSVADIVIDAAGGNVEFKDAGTTQLTLDMDGTSGVQIIKLGVNSDDLVFQQYDGTEVMRVEDGAYLNVSNTTASSSATTGSAIFGGGIGVAADAFIGDDLTLITDSAVLGFGADTDTTLTHTDGTGLTLNGTNKLCFYDTALSIHSSTDGQLDLIADTEIQIAATAVDLNGTLDVSGNSQFSGTVTVGVDDTGKDVKFFGASAGAYMEWDESADQLRIMGASADATTSTGKLLLATSLTDINANDVIGKIEFQAPHEAGGTDAITVAASIQALAQATFSSSVNATDLIFYTGHSEAATEKFRFTSQGELGVGGANYGTDGQILTSTGAGTAPAWEDAAEGGISMGKAIAAAIVFG